MKAVSKMAVACLATVMASTFAHAAEYVATNLAVAEGVDAASGGAYSHINFTFADAQNAITEGEGDAATPVTRVPDFVALKSFAVVRRNGQASWGDTVKVTLQDGAGTHAIRVSAARELEAVTLTNTSTEVSTEWNVFTFETPVVLSTSALYRAALTPVANYQMCMVTASGKTDNTNTTIHCGSTTGTNPSPAFSPLIRLVAEPVVAETAETIALGTGSVKISAGTTVNANALQAGAGVQTTLALSGGELSASESTTVESPISVSADSVLSAAADTKLTVPAGTLSGAGALTIGSEGKTGTVELLGELDALTGSLRVAAGTLILPSGQESKVASVAEGAKLAIRLTEEESRFHGYTATGLPEGTTPGFLFWNSEEPVPEEDIENGNTVMVRVNTWRPRSPVEGEPGKYAWNNADNWSFNAVPEAGATVKIEIAEAGQATVLLPEEEVSVKGLAVSGVGTLEIEGQGAKLSVADLAECATDVTLSAMTMAAVRIHIDEGKTLSMGGETNIDEVLAVDGEGAVRILSGTQTLSRENGYAGGTIVEEGATFRITHPQAFGTGAISGAGKVQVSGGATIAFPVSNAYTGGTVIDEGATVELVRGIAGIGTGMVSGAGTLVLTGAYTGATNIDPLEGVGPGDASAFAEEWTGEAIFRVTGTRAKFVLGRYGNEHSTIVFDGAQGWIGAGTTSAAPVRLDGTGLSLTNGNSGTAAEVTFPKLTGSGTFNGVANVSKDFMYDLFLHDIGEFTGSLSINTANNAQMAVLIGQKPTVGFDHATYAGKIAVLPGAHAAIGNGITWRALNGYLVEEGAELSAYAIGSLARGANAKITVNGTLAFLSDADVNEATADLSAIVGTGTIHYQSTGNYHRTLPNTSAKRFASTLALRNDQQGGLIITECSTGSGSPETVVGTLSGSGPFRADWGGGTNPANTRTLRILQSANSEYAGNLILNSGADRLTEVIVSGTEGATEKTLTLSGETTQARPLEVDTTGSVVLAESGSWAGAMTVAGRIGGSGTVAGALTFAEGATLDATAGALTVNGGLTYPASGTVAVVANAYGPVLKARGVDASKFALAASEGEARAASAGADGVLVATADALVLVERPEAIAGCGDASAQKIAACAANASRYSGYAVAATTHAADGAVRTLSSEEIDAALALFSGEGLLAFDKGSDTVSLAYDFGVARLGIRTIDGALRVVVAAKAQNGQGAALTCDSANLRLTLDGKALENVTVVQPGDIGEAGEAGVTWLSFPFDALEGNATFRIGVRAVTP